MSAGVFLGVALTAAAAVEDAATTWEKPKTTRRLPQVLCASKEEMR